MVWAGSGEEEAGLKVRARQSVVGGGIVEGGGRGNVVRAGSGEEEAGFKVEASGI